MFSNLAQSTYILYYIPALVYIFVVLGLLADVQAAEDESVFLLHACAHNPTGVDPSQEQWAELSELMKAKKHIAFFDCAYQVRR